MHKRGFLVGCLLVILASSVFPVGPNLLSYQGRVLTSSGVPVADATYPASFVFYPSSVGGSPLWSEPTTISTSAGLFTHALGSVLPIPSSMFTANPEIWLEVTVNGQVQAPRTQLMSAGNALAVSTIDSAMGGTIRSGIYVGQPSVTNGYVNLYSSYASFPTAGLFEYGGFGPALELYRPNGTMYSYLRPDQSGSDGGEFYVANGNNLPAFAVDGNYSGGNSFIFMLGASSVYFDLSLTNNSSVQLPSNAIAAPEIYDEPGLASNFSASMVLSPLTTAASDLTTVSITIPAPGYISLSGQVMATVSGSDAAFANRVVAEISETAGISPTSPYRCWYDFLGNPNGLGAIPINCQRVFYKASAGTYTFRLQGNKVYTTPVYTSYPILTAVYYSTSYGSVVTAVSTAEVGDFESATLVGSGEAQPINEAPRIDMYMVDLRELELKVAKSRAETERLGRELAEARLKEKLNAKSVITADKK